MRGFWINLINPGRSLAKWLLLIVVVTVISLGATGYLEVIKEFLDAERFSFLIGEFRISIYLALKVILLIILIFGAAASISDIAEHRIEALSNLRSSSRMLLLKLVQIGIYFLAFLLTLDVIGIDLTTLTVFSGALGIGLGFGLQKIASNFISGVILLLEKTVEQDDLMEMSDGTFGFVRKAHARFTLVETFDGKEMMIPNEDFITSRVTNWTYSNSRARVEIAIGVSYGSDLELTREIMLKAAREHERCLSEPEPACFLRNFGDSSIDFKLFFWIEDITKGRWGPQSDVMFEIWRQFKLQGIEIPFPQHDVHIKNAEKIGRLEDE